MKKLMILCGCFFQLTVALQAQTKPAKPPSQKEMEAMKRQMQEQLNKLTPEQRKLMEEMGVQMPDLPQLDKAANIARSKPQAAPGKALQSNVAKMAAMPTAPSPAGLQAFVARLHTAIKAKLPAETVGQTQQILRQLKAEGNDAAECGKAAVGLWISGRPEMAILMAGEVCMTDAGYAENINNYAAMLTMMDAQQMAVPLLQCLNKQYPNNATILGNLGQAWYGLGDFKKAEHYLDSAIRRFPKHSQANYTKSQIQEGKGDKKGAAESLKNSLDGGYTDEKANELRRLGYPSDGDVAWPLHIPQDPLGFNDLKWPAFPKSLEESESLKPEWQSFRQQANAMADVYSVQSDKLMKEAEEAGAKRIKQLGRDFSSGAAMEFAGPLSTRAGKKLSYLLDDKDGGLASQLQEATDELLSLRERLAVFDSALARALKQLDDLKCFAGEGTAATDKERCCQIMNEANTQWLVSCNGLIENTYTRAADLYRRMWSAQAYFFQYTMDELTYEAYKAQIKSQYAATMAAASPVFASQSVFCEKQGENPFKKKPLQDFDDIACQYHSKLDFKVLQINTDCSKMTTSVDLDKFKFSFTEDLNKSKGILPGAITRATVDVSVSLGSKSIGKWGPVKVEASAGADLHVELDGQGVKEVTVTVGANVEAGTDMFENATSIGSAVKEGGKAYMEKTGKTVLLPGVGDKSASVGGTLGTITINSSNGIVGSGAFNGLKL